MNPKLLSALLAFSLSCSGSAEGAPFSGTIIERESDLSPAYDYVVVGGGVSGLVVANRLSEDPKTTVLVIEAGKIDNYSQEIQYPRYTSVAGVGNSWSITSLPIPGLNNRTAGVAAARVLGGGSAINGMAFDRGSPGDYDLWGEVIGDNNWSWDGLLPYFKKSETFTPPTAEQQAEYGISFDMSVHGTSGPVQSSYPPFISTTGKAFMSALRQLRIPIQPDGTANAIGGFWNPNSLDPVVRERSYARTTYHELSSNRPNYHVLPETLVTKLTPDLSGVEYVAGYNPAQNAIAPNTMTRRVQARKEIIMAAGALHTPKILQLSGIGSSSVLDRLGIKKILNLPGVGENFQDHPVQYLTVAITNLSDPTQDPSYLNQNTTYDAEMGVLYEKNRTGPWTVSTGNTFAFLTAEHLNISYTHFADAAQQPAAQYLRPGVDSTIINGFEKVKAAMLRSMTRGAVALTENLFGGVACLQKPLSRGSVHAASTDPYAMPLVDYRSFSNPLDLQILVQSIRFNTDILPQTDAYRTIGAFVQTPEAGLSDVELAGVIRASAFPSFAHPSGTCAMLKLEDGGCVDNQLRLYGSHGRARVVDASIFPVVPSSHTQSTVYAVAEKAADIIKAQN
ncbi:hypothetical protein BJX63DRAFT_444926 [Aspergillus granulosus]|uniref:Glucose-methanol-choline oxidoreductase N-terminal domain-containing protein n=1 Tax=Aspergillus granulosus TaxID=176169 RepID=A0ABR4H5E6_9EURO